MRFLISIRGFNASASLKRGHATVRDRADVSAIRGFNASASLKPTRLAHDYRTARQLSEALTPRPH